MVFYFYKLWLSLGQIICQLMFIFRSINQKSYGNNRRIIVETLALSTVNQSHFPLRKEKEVEWFKAVKESVKLTGGVIVCRNYISSNLCSAYHTTTTGIVSFRDDDCYQTGYFMLFVFAYYLHFLFGLLKRKGQLYGEEPLKQSSRYISPHFEAN